MSTRKFNGDDTSGNNGHLHPSAAPPADDARNAKFKSLMDALGIKDGEPSLAHHKPTPEQFKAAIEVLNSFTPKDEQFTDAISKAIEDISMQLDETLTVGIITAGEVGGVNDAALDKLAFAAICEFLRKMDKSVLPGLISRLGKAITLGIV